MAVTRAKRQSMRRANATPMTRSSAREVYSWRAWHRATAERSRRERETLYSAVVNVMALSVEFVIGLAVLPAEHLHVALPVGREERVQVHISVAVAVAHAEDLGLSLLGLVASTACAVRLGAAQVGMHPAGGAPDGRHLGYGWIAYGRPHHAPFYGHGGGGGEAGYEILVHEVTLSPGAHVASIEVMVEGAGEHVGERVRLYASRLYVGCEQVQGVSLAYLAVPLPFPARVAVVGAHHHPVRGVGQVKACGPVVVTLEISAVALGVYDPEIGLHP